MTPEELAAHDNPPKLTVGARALSKHAHRSREKFWGEVLGLSEEVRNKNAIDKLKQLLRECVWVNIHCLPPDIIECRVKEGYG